MFCCLDIKKKRNTQYILTKTDFIETGTHFRYV